MEIIQNSSNKTHRHRKVNAVWYAILLIVVGLIFLGKNLGYIDHYTYKMLISWQMLLIVIGLFAVAKRQYAGGLMLLAVGAFFLVPRMVGWVDGGWVRTYWPLLLIAVGMILIVRKMLPQANNKHSCCHFREENRLADGYLRSDNMFSSVKHIVLDPAFKGATIKNSFAGTIIDFRSTKLDAAETVVEVDCLFSGIELYAPGSWYITSELRPVFGGYNDKRFKDGVEVDYNHKLIIRGNITFSGLEVKS